MAETEELDEVAEEELPTGPVSATTRVLVLTAAAVAILLLGAAVGLLIKLPGSGAAANNPGPGSIEVGFAQDMGVHHLQAVTMANWARDHTQDPQIRQLAFDIESTQLDQEGRMRGWLMLWGQPEQSPTGRYMAWMAGPSDGMAGMPGMNGNQMPADGVDHMPGYATNAEISKLQSMSGPDMDTYFLQLMLRHHLGGAPMAQFAADHSSVPAVRVLAENILKSQSAEVDLIKQMLAAKNAQPLPMN
ncbi:DUF305 domain-containing protein [Kutzneria kofuensis]|uniref:Uncharacterized protein (DUF305 family) n=1 Tax=Kutzneria kofuensis TaxID=103725 RepID=A0A7W9KL24_9PSEU|nr:DUF305 domain-containing protein [Kutzneria kofuensis]MBB5893824.1 uncharacterized protein (DUF305 family) [Kutzneria kofuensis]